MGEGQRKYSVVDERSGEAVVEYLPSRAKARLAKRELEYKNRAENGFRPTPSRYWVETDIDHKNGAGIYLH